MSRPRAQQGQLRVKVTLVVPLMDGVDPVSLEHANLHNCAKNR